VNSSKRLKKGLECPTSDLSPDPQWLSALEGTKDSVLADWDHTITMKVSGQENTHT
jgi:hypothetical protein